MTVTKRIKRIVIGVAAAGVAAVAVAVTVPANAATEEEKFGQVWMITDTVPRNLNSLQPAGNVCTEVDWEIIDEDELDFLLVDAIDDELNITKGTQMTFHGYSSKDCTGTPASTIVHTYGDPVRVERTGGVHEIPWTSEALLPSE